MTREVGGKQNLRRYLLLGADPESECLFKCQLQASQLPPPGPIPSAVKIELLLCLLLPPAWLTPTSSFLTTHYEISGDPKTNLLGIFHSTGKTWNRTEEKILKFLLHNRSNYRKPSLSYTYAPRPRPGNRVGGAQPQPPGFELPPPTTHGAAQGLSPIYFSRVFSGPRSSSLRPLCTLGTVTAYTLGRLRGWGTSEGWEWGQKIHRLVWPCCNLFLHHQARLSWGDGSNQQDWQHREQKIWNSPAHRTPTNSLKEKHKDQINHPRGVWAPNREGPLLLGACLLL